MPKKNLISMKGLYHGLMLVLLPMLDEFRTANWLEINRELGLSRILPMFKFV
jgi:hypothetical protein